MSIRVNTCILCFLTFLTNVSFGMIYRKKSSVKIRAIKDCLIFIGGIGPKVKSFYKKACVTWEPEEHNLSFKEMVEKEEISVHKKSFFTGTTPLHRFCEHNQLAMVKFCIKKGADVNAKKRNNETPLIISCKNGFFDVAYTLVKKGALINYTLPYFTERYEKIEKLNKTYRSPGAISRLCSRQIFGYTPLIWACKGNHYDIAYLLIKYGALVNMSTASDDDSSEDHEATPLFWACKHKNLKLIRLLLATGATIDKKVLEVFRKFKKYLVFTSFL